jgi:hypothetical protein
MPRSPRQSKQPKLTKLREWLTVDEAARWLSLTFDDEVSRADVLRAGLDRHLQLSVRFVNHAYAKVAPPTPTPEELAEIHRRFEERIAEVKTARAAGVPPPPPPAPRREPARVLILDDSTIYDLPLVSADRLDVEHQYQKLTDGPAVTLIDIDGTFVDAPDATRLQLLEPYESQTKDGPVKGSVDYIPAGGLPDDAVLVVRRGALDTFVSLVAGADKAPVGKRERDTFLTMMAALLEIAKLGGLKPTEAANKIASETTRLGNTLGVRTVLSKLQEVREVYGKL